MESILQARILESARHHAPGDDLGMRCSTSSHAWTQRQDTRLGARSSSHALWPFGEEITAQGQDDLTHKYTGHERDFESNLDYMHARHYAYSLGRFMSPDPVNGKPGNPQSWNLYSYVQNNPLKFTDPFGQALQIFYVLKTQKLDPKEVMKLIQMVKKIFKDAGIKDVYSYLKGAKGRDITGKDVRVEVTITDKRLSFGRFGETDKGATTSRVSTHDAPVGENATMNFLANVTAHEIGHGTGGLPKRWDSVEARIAKTWEPPLIGTIMAPNQENWEFGQTLEQFDPEDALLLQLLLND